MKNKTTYFISALIITMTLAQTSYAQTTNITETKPVASEQKLEQDFDGLGGNEVLLEKARALNPEVHTTIVQNRMVDRSMRFELSGDYANSFGGDTYIKTGTFSLNGRFHFTNRWALGAKYGMSFNKLTNEGDKMVDDAYADHLANPQSSNAPVPDIDYPKSLMLGYLEFYPLYGKMSWLGKSVSHFDIYGQLGYGNIALDSGTTSALSGAMGIGIWGTEHLTTRFEISYLDYTAKYYTGDMKQGVTSVSAQVGWLF